MAYCSDAGTPGLSDPGALLARRAREAGHKVSPLPGPSAFAALISAAGMGGRSFLFDGFPSPKAGKRRARLAELMAREESFVLYESPHRIIALMEEIAAGRPCPPGLPGPGNDQDPRGIPRREAPPNPRIAQGKGRGARRILGACRRAGIGVNYLHAEADTFVERQGSEMTIDRLNSIDPIRDPQKPSLWREGREGSRRRFHLHLLGRRPEGRSFQCPRTGQGGARDEVGPHRELKAKINQPSYIDDAVVSMTADRIIDQLFGYISLPDWQSARLCVS